MGLAERCDALVVVVSEERGEVSLMEWPPHRARGRRNETDGSMLENLCSRPAAELGRPPAADTLFSNAGVKVAALGLAGLIWSASFLSTGTTVRTVIVPVELDGVPRGMEVSLPWTDHLEVQVRGGSWLMDSVSLTRLVARFNLAGKAAGTLTIPVNAADVDLPPGIIMERVVPSQITVRLAPRRQ